MGRLSAREFERGQQSFDAIEPSDTRLRLIRALKMLPNKVDKKPWKKHGNIPL